MDLTLVGYTVSVFVTLLALSTYSHWGVAEVHTYTIPPYLEERGYTSKIVANQVVDSMRRIQLEVSSLRETKVVVQGQAQPIGDVASYFGIVELLRATEGLLGLDPRVVALEITQNEDTAHWRVRGDHIVHGFTIRQGDVPLKDPDALIDYLGLQVVSYVSPFEALAFHFIQDSDTGKYETTIEAASELLVDCKQIYSWACTDSNIKNAYLLCGMANLYSDRLTRAFDDFAAANKIGAESALGVAFYGDAFTALGQEDAAKREYAKAQALDRDIGERFLALATGYAQSGKHRLADRRFATAAELGLTSDTLMAGWGDTLFKLGWYESALEKYRYAEAFDTTTELYADRIDRAQKALTDSKAAPSSKPAVPEKPAAMGETKPVQPAEPAPAPTK
ncbi:hypothetical protein BAL199_15683 [alpha proteobacterium BAL199]|nr:hypothetical protein BAL199_15683 [alpha proteobacterium BAL199]